uniref:Uncharacterized protein n=1 Tax=Lepeophtheirus salmonis TaxID=72036 RepID=A0A0K2U1S3_LEPSM
MKRNRVVESLLHIMFIKNIILIYIWYSYNEMKFRSLINFVYH